jgi:hypothetical protein
VACIQPDSIRPAAKIPSFAFRDAMFSSNQNFYTSGAKMSPKRHDSVNRIIVGIDRNSSA